jgi:hypothetical protein
LNRLEIEIEDQNTSANLEVKNGEIDALIEFKDIFLFTTPLEEILRDTTKKLEKYMEDHFNGRNGTTD